MSRLAMATPGPILSHRQVTGDRKVIARLVREFGYGAAGGNGMESTAGDEVESQEKNAAAIENALADEFRNVFLILESA